MSCYQSAPFLHAAGGKADTGFAVVSHKRLTVGENPAGSLIIVFGRVFGIAPV